MSMCAVCRRTAPDGHHLCPQHTGDLGVWLTELPGLTRDLAEFVAPAGRPHTGRLGGTGRAHSPAPVDLRVLALLGPGHPQPPDSDDPDAGGTIPIKAFLDGWAGRLAYDYTAVHRDHHGTLHTTPCDAYRAKGGPTIDGWCHFLTAYIPYTATRPWAGDFHHQLGDLTAHARTLTHSTPSRHPREAPCPRCAAFRLITTDTQPDVHCEACGHHMTTTDYNQHATDFLHTLTHTPSPVAH